jgi:hypothetical protein
VAVAILGFPLVLALEWVFEVTSEGVRREPVSDHEADEAGRATEAHLQDAVTAPPVEGGHSAARARFRRRPLLLVPAGVVLIFALAAAWGLWQGQPEPEPALSSSAVAVLPFSVRGGEDARYVGEGIVNLLGTALNGAGALRAVDARAMFDTLAQEGGGTDLERGRRVAGRLWAGLAVDSGPGADHQADAPRRGASASSSGSGILLVRTTHHPGRRVNSSAPLRRTTWKLALAWARRRQLRLRHAHPLEKCLEARFVPYTVQEPVVLGEELVVEQAQADGVLEPVQRPLVLARQCIAVRQLAGEHLAALGGGLELRRDRAHGLVLLAAQRVRDGAGHGREHGPRKRRRGPVGHGGGLVEPAVVRQRPAVAPGAEVQAFQRRPGTCGRYPAA